jgi:hypothetical protein
VIKLGSEYAICKGEKNQRKLNHTHVFVGLNVGAAVGLAEGMAEGL